MTPNPDPAFIALDAALWERIGTTPDKQGAHVREARHVAAEPGYSDARIGTDFAVLSHLERALDLARASWFATIADAFAAVAPRMPWSQNPAYTEETVGRDLLDGYAYANLSGPEGPIHRMAPRGGFYLMGPEVLYPAHNHAPAEIYLVMTPGVSWSLDKGAWFDVRPGTLLHHTPWQWHAMRSAGEPVLAYTAWMEPGDRSTAAMAAPTPA